MKIYTTVEPVPSRMLAVVRLLLVEGPLNENDVTALIQPREDTSMAKKTLDAAVECKLILKSRSTCSLNHDLIPKELKANDLDEVLPRVSSSVLLSAKVSGESNSFAFLCAWLLHQKVLEMPADRGGFKKAAEEQGLSLSEFQIQNDARWDNLLYWARYLGLVRQTRDEPCAGVVPDPTLFLQRHLPELLPAGKEITIEAFCSTLGEICPVLDGGIVRKGLLSRISANWPEAQLSDSLSFAIERLERGGQIRAWCPDDQRNFMITPADKKIAYLARLK